MREDIIIPVIVAMISFVVLGVIIRTIVSNSINKKLIKKFLQYNKAIKIGTFECRVEKNFWALRNANHDFTELTLFKIKNGLLISPNWKIAFGFREQLKPFVVSNNELHNIILDAFPCQISKSSDQNTIIKVQAGFNTKLEITIYDLEEQIEEYLN